PHLFRAPLKADFKVGPIHFNGNAVIALVVVVAVTAGLAILLQRTHIGLAVRASAESSDRASLLGISVPQMHALVWVLATLLSSVSLILRTQLFGLPATSLLGPSYLLLTLAAAVMGG